MNLDFYKNKFDRELKRRVDLDSSINIPILGITIIVGLVSYILEKNDFKDWSIFDFLIIELVIATGLTTILSLFFIFYSSNNLFSGFNYLNFDLLSEYRKIEIFNSNCKEEERVDLENHIKDKIVLYSDNHTTINDRRSKNLYYARTFVIISFIITIINIILLTIITF